MAIEPDPAPPQPAHRTTPAAGLLDIHSHLIPGIDDGCAELAESLRAIEALREAGFVGSFCTPHVWPEAFPMNLPEHIHAWVDDLRRELEQRGIDYHLWPGGEVRVHREVVAFFKAYGVPTLGPSRCVLCDFWSDRWPRYADAAFEWLLAEGYQPVLAHPERINVHGELDKRLTRLEKMGVWLQGNTRCLTGEEGYQQDRWVRRLLSEGRYRFMALDMHRPDSLPARLDGLALLEAEFGQALVEDLFVHAPRRDLLSTAPVKP